MRIQKLASARWGDRSYRYRRALIKPAVRPGQTSILDYFDVQAVYDYIEETVSIRTEIYRFCGRDDSDRAAPLLQRIYENAQKNSQMKVCLVLANINWQGLL